MEEVAEKLMNLSPAAVRELAPELSIEQIAYVSPLLGKEKVEAIFEGAIKQEQIEALGSGLKKEQIDPLLKTTEHWRLSALLVGIPQSTFIQLLLSKEDIKVIQHEALTEPVQHHITEMIYILESKSGDFHRKLEEIEQQIQAIDPTKVTFHRFNVWQQQLMRNKTRALEYAYQIDLALSVAWNSNRPDLIQRLNELKELFKFVSDERIGVPGTSETAPTGFFGMLENHLNHVYGDITLNDDEPGIEALAKLSIWYAHDYWKLGLLPHLSEEQLELDPENHSDKECLEHLKKIGDSVHNQLAVLGLETVGDFKRKHIYSAEMLSEYISKNCVR